MIKLCAFADEAGKELSTQIQALKRNNLSLLEIRTVDGISVSEFSIEQAKEYEKILSDNGISVWSIGSPLGKVDISVDWKNYMNTVKHVLELANVFKTDKIRMFSFYNAYSEKNKVMEYLGEMVETAKKYGVNLYHENEKEIYGDNAERNIEILDNVKGIKSIYDPANYLQVGESAENTLSLLHYRADYFHIKDVIVETGELVPAGYGDGKLDKVVEMIKDDKVLTVEPHLAIFDEYGKIDNTEMKNKFKFSSNAVAFDTAVDSIKNILVREGYKESGDKFIR